MTPNPTPPITMASLAQQALDVQNACNLCGVAQSFARAMRSFSELCPELGTDARNTHPIAIVWADKIAHLTGTQSFSVQDTSVGRAYEAVAELAGVAL